MLKNVVWFKERQIGEITLGGLLILVLVRTIQYNMAHMRVSVGGHLCPFFFYSSRNIVVKYDKLL